MAPTMERFDMPASVFDLAPKGICAKTGSFAQHGKDGQQKHGKEHLT